MVRVLLRVARLLIVGGMFIGAYEEMKNTARAEVKLEMLERELNKKENEKRGQLWISKMIL